jgi:hypothetical protein
MKRLKVKSNLNLGKMKYLVYFLLLLLLKFNLKAQCDNASLDFDGVNDHQHSYKFSLI